MSLATTVSGSLTGGSIGVVGGQTYITNVTSSTATSTASWYNTSSTSGITLADIQTEYLQGDIEVQPNSTMKLPDGSVVKVDALGNFTVCDKDAVVTYRGSNVREFNRHINASDLLEAFIGDLGKLGVKQDEVLGIPIEMFINWLIFQAAEQDGDDAPADVPLLESSVNPHKHPKCLGCGRFIRKTLVEHKVHFCNPEHHERYLKRIGI